MEDSEDNSCPICFEQMLNYNCCTTSCKHSFHLECLIKSYAICGKNCPCCRQQIIINNNHAATNLQMTENFILPESAFDVYNWAQNPMVVVTNVHNNNETPLEIVAQIQAANIQLAANNQSNTNTNNFILPNSAIDVHCWGQNPTITATIYPNDTNV